ncbi:MULTISPECIES: glycosyltransferase family A protein [Actinosynnema]|uniref:glycosyltransferase family 2 protein n=1 Tax=Actinosynnema TaxID=40566 RepID=UPI0020A4DBA5|nr:glycosyltransferase family A protein [Actinosynnema pretiosum]MCP2097740.1 Glycosyl transferase family 2 [Actinosynnema pretiosum]
MPPRLSVVIPTRDRPRSLAESLSSLVTQELGDALEVIVVNDGGALVDEVVAPFRDRLAIELIGYPSGAGPSTARNTAIEAASGEYLGFLDDDDVVLPGHFAATMAALDEDRADFVYTTTMVSTTRAPVGMTHESGGWPAFDVPFDAEFLHVTNFIPPVGVTMRAPGPRGARFDESLTVVEDWDFWLALLNRHSYRFLHLERASGVYHRLPRYDSAPDPPAETARVLRMFYESHVAQFSRWPLPEGSRAEVSREHVKHTYELALARLGRGKPLPAYWYERMVRLLHGELTGSVPTGQLRERLDRAMNG